jgi:hypothetical protein
MTNVKLIHILLLFFIIIDEYVSCFLYGYFRQHDKSALRHEALNGLNYGSWRKTIEIALALWEIDLALTTDPPKDPA